MGALIGEVEGLLIMLPKGVGNTWPISRSSNGGDAGACGLRVECRGALVSFGFQVDLISSSSSSDGVRSWGWSVMV